MIFDIALLIIMLICIGRGYKRGVLRTVVSIVGIAAAFVLASVISSYENCEKIYDGYLHEHIRPYIDSAVKDAKEQALNKLDSELRSITESYIDEYLGGSELLKNTADELLSGTDKLRESVPQIVDVLGIDVRTLLTNQAISGKIKEIADTYSGAAADKINERLPLGIKVSEDQVSEIIRDEEAAEALVYEMFGVKASDSTLNGVADYIEKKLVRPVVLRAIGIILWAASFALVNIAVSIISAVITALRVITPVKACDSLAGGILGAAAGTALSAALTTLTVLIIRFTGGITLINEDIISGSLVFRYIYTLISDII